MKNFYTLIPTAVSTPPQTVQKEASRNRLASFCVFVHLARSASISSFSASTPVAMAEEVFSVMF